MRYRRSVLAAFAALALAGCGGSGTTETTSRTDGPPPNGGGRGLVQDAPRAIVGPSPIAGMQDDPLSWPPASDDIEGRLDMVAETGATQVRVDLSWAAAAPTRPKKASDPADPAYQWGRYDRIVDGATTRGLEVLFTVYKTPAWAADMSFPLEQPGDDNSRRPLEPNDYGQFAVALARRYAPKGVLRWEAWNEPNLPLFLQPQWVAQEDGTFVNQSAEDYAELASAFIAGIKSVAPNAEIAGPVTAPAGDACPDACPRNAAARTEPVEFLRLLGREGLQPAFDAVSHHPYPIRPPTKLGPGQSAFDKVNYVDLYNIDRLERAVDEGYLVGKPLWLTEFGYLTRKVKNFTQAFSEADQAEFAAEAYRRVRANDRIKVLTWYFLQDKDTTDPANDWTSGIIRSPGRGGERKPAYDAFRLPFRADADAPVAAGSAVPVLGQVRPAPGATRVVLQARRAGVWRPLRRIATSADGSFDARVRLDRTTRLRVVWNGRDRRGVATSIASVPITVRVAA